MKSEGLGQGLGGANYQYEKSEAEWQVEESNLLRFQRLSKKAKKFKRNQEVYFKIERNLYVTSKIFNWYMKNDKECYF